jgi:hypothetical protein
VWKWDEGTEILRTYSKRDIEEAPPADRDNLVMYSYMIDDDTYGSTHDPEVGALCVCVCVLVGCPAWGRGERVHKALYNPACSYGPRRVCVFACVCLCVCLYMTCLGYPRLHDAPPRTTCRTTSTTASACMPP